MLRRTLVFIVIVVALAFLIAYAKQSWWWIEVHTGTVNESGPYYGFWSGFGSDLGEATLLAGLGAAYRHHNCHAERCFRLGRAVDGTPYVACPKHHPDHHGTKRKVPLHVIHRAHANAQIAKEAA
jgi:hypothetical protein